MFQKVRSFATEQAVGRRPAEAICQPSRLRVVTGLGAVSEYPKVVQERLGHASISATFNRYSHVTGEMQRCAASTFDELFGEATGS